MSEPEVKFKTDVLSNIGWDSDSDDDRPLTCFVTDRVQLMRKIFKRISSKRITQMAPKCLKEMPMSQKKSVLLDELMGISNKRLTSIINNAPDVTKSSSSSEVESTVLKKEIDVISLDDITDDSSEVGIGDDNFMEIKLSERERLEMDFEIIERKHKRKHKKAKMFKNCKKNRVQIKQEDNILIFEQDLTSDKRDVDSDIEVKTTQDDPFVSALNLLELQARARAIRSQLLNEMTPEDIVSIAQTTKNNEVKSENISEPDSPNSVVILSPEQDVVEIHETSDSGEDQVNDESQINDKESINHKIGQEKNKDVKLADTKIEKTEDCEVEEPTNGAIDKTEGHKHTSDVEKKSTRLIQIIDKDIREMDNNSTSKGASEGVSIIEEDNDVLIMNEDDDILI